MQSRVRSASWPDAILTGALAGLVLLAWWALWLWGKSPYGHILMHGIAHARMMAGSLWFLAALFVTGWTLMTIAMMLPTTVPLILLFQRIVRGRPTAAGLIVVLIAGYLFVWTAFGALVQVMNWFLQPAIQHTAWLAGAPWIGGAAILAVAGLYQFSPLKYACLDKCRSPMSFIISRWQGGNEWIQSLRIGVEHGVFCVGCCWSLMLLMFVAGSGSLSWMLLLGAVMALEKNLPWGRKLAAPLGVVLLADAAAMVVTGLA